MKLEARVDGPEGAPVLVLSPSLGTTTDLWRPQLDALTRRFRVIRHDHPGHGSSPAPTGPVRVEDIARGVLELLDRHGVERFSFCGVSLGGMVGLWLGANVPDRVDRLALCCSGAKLGVREDYLARAELVRRAGLESVLAGSRERWFTPAFRDAPEAVVLLADLARISPEGYAAGCEAVAEWDFRAELGRVAVPTLAVFGAADALTTVAVRDEIENGVPDARVVTVPNAAHLANVEQARAVNAVLVGHLDVRSPYERGMTVRRRVLGDAHVERATAEASELAAAFQELITKYAWGEVWSRPGLDLRTRSAITLAALTSLGRFDELELHVRGALRNGLTREEISEVLLQMTIYAGVPAGRNAFEVLARVLREDAD